MAAGQLIETIMVPDDTGEHLVSVPRLCTYCANVVITNVPGEDHVAWMCKKHYFDAAELDSYMATIDDARSIAAVGVQCPEFETTVEIAKLFRVVSRRQKEKLSFYKDKPVV